MHDSCIKRSIFSFFFLCSFARSEKFPPVINVSALLENNSDFNDVEWLRVVNEIGQACIEYGVFNIAGHGLDHLFPQVQHEMTAFFNLSLTEKNSIKRTVNNSRGFADDEFTKQLMDKKQIFDVGHKPFVDLDDRDPKNIVLDGFNQWPSTSSLPNFRVVMENYYKNCEYIAKVLTSAISLSLGLQSDALAKYFETHTSFLRLNYYPIDMNANNTNDEAIFGISRHTDAGALTILLQDEVEGLEVYSGSKQENEDGHWIPIRSIPNALTINTGDMIQVWSNNRYN